MNKLCALVVALGIGATSVLGVQAREFQVNTCATQLGLTNDEYTNLETMVLNDLGIKLESRESVDVYDQEHLDLHGVSYITDGVPISIERYGLCYIGFREEVGTRPYWFQGGQLVPVE